MNRPFFLRRPLALSGLLALPLLLGASATSGGAWHLHLKRALPGVNDTVDTAPAAIKLWFTETPEAAGSRIELSGPGNASVATGKTTLEPGDDAPLVATVTGAMTPGTYQVHWRAMARDGHPMRGSFKFVYHPTR